MIAVTGDLLDVPNSIIDGSAPDGHERSVWLAAVDQDLRIVRNWLENLGSPYVICPGNHDYEPAFANVFPEAGAVVDAVGFRFVSFWDELGPDRQPRRTGDRRKLFDQVLSEPEHKIPQIHIQHYTIEPPILHNDWRYEYVDAPLMKEQVEQSGRVRAVLSGHYHPGTLARCENVTYSGAPAFCEPPHRFRVYDVYDAGSFGVTDHAIL